MNVNSMVITIDVAETYHPNNDPHVALIEALNDGHEIISSVPISNGQKMVIQYVLRRVLYGIEHDPRIDHDKNVRSVGGENVD